MALAEHEMAKAEVPVGRRLLTAADLACLPDTLPSGPVRYELWEGELSIMAPPGDVHGKVESRVVGILAWLGDFAGLGEARSGESGVQLAFDPDTVVGVDAAFLTNDQLPVETTPEGYLITMPALVVEVVSKNDTRPAAQRKVDAYLKAGVRVVWIVDPRQKTLVVHRSDAPAEVLTETDMLTAEGIIPELSFPVARLFQ